MKTLMIIATAVLFAGCGITYDCERDSTSVKDREALKMLDAREVTLTLQDGSQYCGRVDRVVNDTLDLERTQDGLHIAIPADRIKRALLHDKTMGPSLLAGFFGSTGRADGNIDISFGPAGSGVAVVSKQRGLELTFAAETKTIELLGGGTTTSGSPKQPETRSDQPNTTRPGNHR
jgi:hypothetical protein